MIVNVELLAALEAAGVDREKAGAAAVILADYDRRLQRIEQLRVFGRSRSRGGDRGELSCATKNVLRLGGALKLNA